MLLSTMVDSISNYMKVLAQNGFESDGTGDAAWSTRYKNSAGAYVDIRGTGWVMYSKTGVRAVQGKTHKDLQRHFLSYKSKDELLDYIEKHT